VLLVGLAGGAVPYLALAVTCDTAYYIPLYTLSAAFDAFCTVAVRTSHDPPRLRPPFVPLLHPLPPAPCLRVRSSSRVRPQLYSLVADLVPARARATTIGQLFCVSLAPPSPPPPFGGGEGERAPVTGDSRARSAAAARQPSPDVSARRVRLVRGEGRDVSS